MANTKPSKDAGSAQSATRFWDTTYDDPYVQRLIRWIDLNIKVECSVHMRSSKNDRLDAATVSSIGNDWCANNMSIIFTASENERPNGSCLWDNKFAKASLQLSDLVAYCKDCRTYPIVFIVTEAQRSMLTHLIIHERSQRAEALELNAFLREHPKRWWKFDLEKEEAEFKEIEESLQNDGALPRKRPVFGGEV